MIANPDPWRADQHALDVEIDRIVDQAHIDILTLTSSFEARVRVEREERTNVDPYDHAPPVGPLDRVGVCPVCNQRFWVENERNPRIYCSRHCQNHRPDKRAANIAYYRAHRADPVWRARENARARLRYRGQVARVPA